MGLQKNLWALAAMASLAGCASITRGTTDQVQIYATPADAHIRTSLGQTCLSPCTLTVGRKDEFTVTAEKDGYQTQEVQVKTQVAGAGAAGFAGNILLGGPIGMGVDVATGATLEHVPNPVQITLQPIATPQAPPRAKPYSYRPHQPSRKRKARKAGVS